jgi:hypothetical protein
MAFRMIAPIVRPQMMAFSSMAAPIKINRNPILNDLDALRAKLPPISRS